MSIAAIEAAIAKNFLAGFNGFLNTDGYAAYAKLKNITQVGCLAHVRRKFKDAMDILPKEHHKESMAGIGFAIAGLALSAIGTGASFAQAGASRRQQRDAESKAEAMIRQARKRLDINYMEQLSIKKEPYELQREALLQQGATALAAAQEGSQRGVAATAGRLQQAQTQAQGQVRTQMGQELQAIEKAVAEEDARLRDLNVQLDLGEIQGAQQAAADAE